MKNKQADHLTQFGKHTFPSSPGELKTGDGWVLSPTDGAPGSSVYSEKTEPPPFCVGVAAETGSTPLLEAAAIFARALQIRERQRVYKKNEIALRIILVQELPCKMP